MTWWAALPMTCMACPFGCDDGQGQAVDAVLLGAVGGPKYDVLDFSVKPERGLLRRARRWTCSPTCVRRNALTRWPTFSSLKREVVAAWTS